MIGVVIPVYKAQNTIRDALNSLLIQTNKNFIVIPSIDGDNFNYDPIWAGYRARDLGIKPIKSGLNYGPGVARQRGIEAATECEYITFLDADDLLMPTALDIFNTFMSKGLDVLATNFYWERTKNEFLNLDSDKTPITWMHGKCYRRSFLLDHNIEFLPDVRFNEDSYFNLVAWNVAAEEKRLKISHPTYVWRYNESSLTHTTSGKELFEKVMDTYINTQIFGILKIIDLSGDIDTLVLAATLRNIYEYIMKQNFYQITQDNYSKNFRLLKENSVVQSKFDDLKLWDYAITVPQGSNIDYNFFFYKENFLDFIAENIKK